MHRNVQSHASKFLCECLELKTFTGGTITEWPQSKSNMNPIENLWPTVKNKLNEGGYERKSDCWEAIKIIMSLIEIADSKNVTK